MRRRRSRRRGRRARPSRASASARIVVERVDRLGLLDLRDHVRVRAAPARSARAGRARPSAERTNESATKSTPSSSANSRSSRSFSVSDGIGSGTPGRFTPLCELTAPPTTTGSARGRCSTSLDAQPDEPVVDQHVVPGLEHLADHGRRDRQLAVAARPPRRTTTISSPGREHDAARRGRRCAASGPGGRRSARAAGRAPPATSRTSRARSRVLLVRAVREVEPRGVHAGARRARAASRASRRRRPDRRHDLRPPRIAAGHARSAYRAPGGSARARAGTRPSPGTSARSPSSSSMRSSWLYFATRSERAGAPVLIWPALVRDGEVGDRRVLGLARAVRDDRRVAGCRARARSPRASRSACRSGSP